MPAQLDTKRFKDLQRAVYKKLPTGDHRDVITSMPVSILYQIEEKRRRLIKVRQVRQKYEQLSFGDFQTTRQGWGIDPRALREAFENVRSADKLLDFLSVCGPFSQNDLPQWTTWEAFTEWQKFMRARQRFKVSETDRHADPDPKNYDVLSGFLQPLEIGHGDTGPYMIIRCFTALQAIAATIFIDNLQGTTVQKCLHCPVLFSTNPSRPEKKFCSESHRWLYHQAQRRKKEREIAYCRA